MRRLGLHFDFHARPYEGMPRIGERLTETDIREICRTLRPDCIQIDCKGHPGRASYPTELGNAMPDICFDTMELWRRVTKEEGVKLFVHYSGVLDAYFCEKHPQLAVMRADGSRDGSVTRTFGCGYADALLIPQLKELAGKYGVDGAWIDGECWGTDLDYDPETLTGFEKSSGIKLNGRLPTENGSPEFAAFRRYCRELFVEYVRHYTDEVHKAYPSFMIASNWMFSEYMPEPVNVELDFLSGDYNPWNSVNSARLAGRALARQGKPWDLMSWNFRVDRDGYAKGRYVKHPAQIAQEAAAVVSLGGGYQNYITQYKDGSPRMEQIRRMKGVFDILRERQPWCYGGAIVPQIAVFLSDFDRFNAPKKKPFARDGIEGVMGLVALLCDMGHGVSVASEFDFDKGFKLIAVPEAICGFGGFAGRLLEYAAKGGSLLISGAKSIGEFIKAGLRVKAEDAPEGGAYTQDGEAFTAVYGACALNAPDAEAIARVCADARDEGRMYACVLPYGRGLIALIGSDIGLSYFNARQAGHTELMGALLKRLYEPLVCLESAEGTVEITPLRKDGRLLVQLVNMNGPHADTRAASFDRIQPCRDVKLSVSANKKPSAVVQRPCGRSLDFTWDGRRAVFTLDRVDVHEIIEMVEAE